MDVRDERYARRGRAVAVYSVTGMGSHRSRLPLAILVAVVAAGAATLILRPRSGLIDPAAVNPRAYFSARELARARDFRNTQRALAVADLAVGGVALVVVVWRPPRRLLRRAARRPLLGAAAAGAAISVFVAVAELPLGAVMQHRAREVGLATQGIGPWLVDAGKSTGVSAVLAAGGGALALALIRRFRRRWWAPAAVCVVVLGVLSQYLFPVVVAPLFNRFEPLPQGRLRSEVLALARRAGVDVGQVYRVDASRRTTGTNAYVDGIGRTKRVVLYDTLIGSYPRRELLSVVAHELGHVKHRDVPRGLLWLAIVAPAGTYLVQQLAERLGRREGLGDPRARPNPEVLPALALALALVSFALGSASNVLSRKVEASADGFALRLTHDPEAFIDVERRLAISNLIDPSPPRVLQVLFGTHPTTEERIGYAVAIERGARP